MSEVLNAAAQALSAPEMLVRRSAEARAKATGVPVEDVLAAWAGGGAVTASTAAPVTPQPAVVTAAPEPAAVSQPEPHPSVVAVLDPVVETIPQPETPVEPGGLGERVSLGWRAGIWAGLGLAPLVILFSLQWVLPRASLAGEAGAYRVVLDLASGRVIVGSGLLGLVGGLILGGFTRGVVGLKSEGHGLSNRWVSTLAAGGISGLLIGLLLGAVVTGSGETLEGAEGVVEVGAVAAVVTVVVGWMVLGGFSAVVVQFLGTPKGIGVAQLEETLMVRRRLGAAFGLPVRVALTILLIVGPLAYAFLAFPKWAPLTGAFVAASILGFAGLAAVRPNMRTSRGEFGVALIGVLTVVVVIVSVLAAQGGGHG